MGVQAGRSTATSRSAPNRSGRSTSRRGSRISGICSSRLIGTASGTRPPTRGPWRYSKYRLLLFLLTGDPISVRVTESSIEGIQPGDDPRALSQVALDASGLIHTLNVLEGIAAEGKEWIRHQRRRADERLAELTATVRDLID